MDVFTFAIAEAKSAAEQQLGHEVDCGWFSVPEYFNFTMRVSALTAALAVGCEAEDEFWTLTSGYALSEAYGFSDRCLGYDNDSCDRFESHQGVWINYDVSFIRIFHVQMGRYVGPRIWNEYKREQEEEFTAPQLKQMLRQLKKVTEATFDRWNPVATSRLLSVEFVLVSGENSLDRFEVLKNAITSVLGGISIGWQGRDIDPRFAFSAGAARKYSRIMGRRMLHDLWDRGEEVAIPNQTSGNEYAEAIEQYINHF